MPGLTALVTIDHVDPVEILIWVALAFCLWLSLSWLIPRLRLPTPVLIGATLMNHLVSRGIPASRITIISYGKERPVCTEHNQACWARNRRAHFLVKDR